MGDSPACGHVASNPRANIALQDRFDTTPAKILGLQGCGIEKGCHADFVLLRVRNPVEALRLQTTRLAVCNRGKLLSETPAHKAALHLASRPAPDLVPAKERGR